MNKKMSKMKKKSLELQIEMSFNKKLDFFFIRSKNLIYTEGSPL